MKRHVYSRMFTGVVLALSTALIGACSEKFEAMSDVIVNIEYNKKGCPKKVDRDINFFSDFEVGKSNHIIWQTSYPNAKYSIYFDPFNHEPLTSDASGQLRSPDFDNLSPAVEYKYTIVDENCKDKPLDPRFRLR